MLKKKKSEVKRIELTEREERLVANQDRISNIYERLCEVDGCCNVLYCALTCGGDQPEYEYIKQSVYVMTERLLEIKEKLGEYLKQCKELGIYAVKTIDIPEPDFMNNEQL